MCESFDPANLKFYPAEGIAKLHKDIRMNMVTETKFVIAKKKKKMTDNVSVEQK